MTEFTGDTVRLCREMIKTGDLHTCTPETREGLFRRLLERIEILEEGTAKIEKQYQHLMKGSRKLMDSYRASLERAGVDTSKLDRVQ